MMTSKPARKKPVPSPKSQKKIGEAAKRLSEKLARRRQKN